MIKEKNLELFECSPLKQFQNNTNSIQDKEKSSSNSQFNPTKITKKQKDFIIRNNKGFYKEFKKVYMKNIELKNKLNEIITEKNRLKQIINKLEQKSNYSNYLNNINDITNSNIYTNSFNSISDYIKNKRKRRKKAEIINKYNCIFPNCDKIYSSKGSLNMHIRLKHQQK